MRVISPEETSVLLTCLDCLPFFDTFSDWEKLELLLAGADLITYQTGEFLIQQGSSDRVLFFLLSGRASVVREGASIPLAELLPGDFFGEISFLTKQKRTSNVIVHSRPNHSPEIPSSVLSEKLIATLCPDETAPIIVICFEHSILAKLNFNTRSKIKDQIIAVLVVRIEKISELVEEFGKQVPVFSKEPDLNNLIAGESMDFQESAKDQIIQNLVEYIVILHHTLQKQTPDLG
ncbi:MAG: cyclic nucleotide-binding domain-containing protein [Magnetococcales bacterium]|nr:cyclic nucleotide-binding domain-containing protein [Magnetococcales bacterium]